MSEVTPRRWRALAQRVLDHCATVGDRPSLEARAVLQALISLKAREETPPAIRVWSTQIGIERRRLQAALYDLCCAGLVYMQPHGSKPSTYELNRLRIDAWAKGLLSEDELWAEDGTADWSPTGTATGPTDGPVTACQWSRDGTGEHNEPLWAEDGTAPRARGNSSSSSPTSPTSSPTPTPAIPDVHEVRELHTAMVSAVRRALSGGLSQEARDHIYRWVGVYPVALVQAACQKAALKGGHSVDYIEQIMENERVDAELGPPPDDSRVSRLVDFRQPWVGGAR